MSDQKVDSSSDRRRAAAAAPHPDPVAERGKPEAEHGQYGLVREGSSEAEGLSEEQIRGVESTKPQQTAAGSRPVPKRPS